MGTSRSSQFCIGKARQHYLHYIIHASRCSCRYRNPHPWEAQRLYDRLSRNVPATDLDIDASKQYDARSDLELISVLQLCDPAADLPYITAHTKLLQHCQHLLVQ